MRCSLAAIDLIVWMRSHAAHLSAWHVAGASIPTLYGGTTFDCAAMETVFHDVPIAPG